VRGYDCCIYTNFKGKIIISYIFLGKVSFCKILKGGWCNSFSLSDFIVRLEKFTFATKGNMRESKHILDFIFKDKSFFFFPFVGKNKARKRGL